jgi:hypothetical protein
MWNVDSQKKSQKKILTENFVKIFLLYFFGEFFLVIFFWQKRGA